MKTDRLFKALYRLRDFPDSLRADTARGQAFRKRVQKRVVTNSFQDDRILLSEGQIQTTMYFLNRGFARGFFHNKDTLKEETHILWNDSSFVVAPDSFYQQRPSRIAIQVCAGSEVISATLQDMQAVFAEFPEGEIMTRSVPIQYLEMEQWRSWIVSMPAKERYQALLKEFPGIERHIKAGDIAFYLNMAPETLSRIKREIS